MASNSSLGMPYGFTPIRALVFFLDRLRYHNGHSEAIEEDLKALGFDPAQVTEFTADAIRWIRDSSRDIDSSDAFAHFIQVGLEALAFFSTDVRAHISDVLEASREAFEEPQLLSLLLSALADHSEAVASARSVQPPAEWVVDSALGASLRRHLEERARIERESSQGRHPSSRLPLTRRDPEAPARRPKNSAPPDLRTALQAAVGPDFEIGEPLGYGGYGAVFRATQLSLGRQVAVKTILLEHSQDQETQRAFLKEANVIAALDHKNIVVIHQLGFGSGIYWYSMPYVRGGSLATRLAERKSHWGLDEAVSVLRQAAEALDYAHHAGVVHRDVKPGNTLIDRSGRVLMADFGIAKLLDPGLATRTGGGPIGTPPFIAPELWAYQPAIPASDQYSLGVMAFQVLTGQLPFRFNSASNWGLQHLSATPTSLRELRADVPESGANAIARALAKSPSDRFANCSEFIDALSQVATAKPSGPEPQKAIRIQATPVAAQRDAPLKAQQSGIPPLPTWWLGHLGQLADYTVESGEEASTKTRTGRHHLLWQEATEWLAEVTRIVLDHPGERWLNNPSQYQQGKLSGTYYGRLYPDSNPELKDAFHIGIQISKKLKWVDGFDPMYSDLQLQAAGPIVTVWASTNDNLIKRLDRPDLHDIDGALQHQILAGRPELWHAGGALVRARKGTKSILMSPKTYLEAVDRGEVQPRCSIFGPLITAEEVQGAPNETARRIAGFLTLLAEPVREVRKAAANG